MLCYLVRHGKDDDTIRGGWSNHGLTASGIVQVHELAKKMTATNMKISCMYSSDLERAKETSRILADYLKCPIIFTAEFREVNNGDLAGLKNELADDKYPGLYWAALEYEESYPNGESPKMFFERIKTAWLEFKSKVVQPSEDVLLVTHGGVMEVILCIENGVEFSNKTRHFSTPNVKAIPIKIQEIGGDKWNEPKT